MQKHYFQANLKLLQRYVSEHDGALPPDATAGCSNARRYKGVSLSLWCSEQKERYLQGKLSDTHIQEIQMTVPALLASAELDFQSTLGILQQYMAEHVTQGGEAAVHRMPNKHAVYKGVQLGAWCQRQRTAYFRGRLSEKQATALQQVVHCDLMDWFVGSPVLNSTTRWHRYSSNELQQIAPASAVSRQQVQHGAGGGPGGSWNVYHAAPNAEHSATHDAAFDAGHGGQQQWGSACHEQQDMVSCLAAAVPQETVLQRSSSNHHRQVVFAAGLASAELSCAADADSSCHTPSDGHSRRQIGSHAETASGVCAMQFANYSSYQSSSSSSLSSTDATTSSMTSSGTSSSSSSTASNSDDTHPSSSTMSPASTSETLGITTPLTAWVPSHRGRTTGHTLIELNVADFVQHAAERPADAWQFLIDAEVSCNIPVEQTHVDLLAALVQHARLDVLTQLISVVQPQVGFQGLVCVLSCTVANSGCHRQHYLMHKMVAAHVRCMRVGHMLWSGLCIDFITMTSTPYASVNASVH